MGKSRVAEREAMGESMSCLLGHEDHAFISTLRLTGIFTSKATGDT